MASSSVQSSQVRPTFELRDRNYIVTGGVQGIGTDVTNQQSLETSFKSAVRELRSIDGCVPCAGIAIDKLFLDQTWDELTRIQEINIRTPGSMVLIASQSAHIALPGYRMAAYTASKGAVMMQAKVLAVELASSKIGVNTISPGFVDSEMTRAVRAAMSERAGAQMWLSPPNQRLITTDDLTGAVIYLLSDAARHTTAADIPITGGLHAGTIDGSISYEV
ncbi:hypothetical protein BKA56DRAFT_643440 [Ilyonectria sp. MPI-CAGE-AT-0026]|nr:hypothetical protein BKA56DRAFT_643440 [Ilyonectria sp. MPI-CAGE-AT-0026]